MRSLEPLRIENGEKLKHCPRCDGWLPLSDFGICRARRDGLNLYCKLCIRQKITTFRQKLREYKKAQIKHARPAVTIDHKSIFSRRRIARILRKLTPADRVREAIRLGAHTQKEIHEVTKLPKDEVCDALSNLLLWTREIQTRVVRHQRMYFVREQVAHPVRKEMVPSFSVIKELHPLPARSRVKCKVA